jgi:hypothetical protein
VFRSIALNRTQSVLRHQFGRSEWILQLHWPLARVRPLRLPSTMKVISRGCFWHCAQLTSLIFEAGCQVSAESASDFRSGLPSECRVTLN